MVEIFLERENKTINKEIKMSITLKSLLKELNISINSVILTVNGEIALEDSKINNGDKVQILSVVSGG